MVVLVPCLLLIVTYAQDIVKIDQVLWILNSSILMKFGLLEESIENRENLSMISISIDKSSI